MPHSLPSFGDLPSLMNGAMRNLYFSTRFVLLITLLSACQKESAGPVRRALPADLQGTIFYEFADEGVTALELRSGKKQVVLPGDIRRNQWDLSKDGSRILTASDISGHPEMSRYVLRSLLNEKVLHQFDYLPGKGSSLTTGLLAPDASCILIEPTFEQGIVLVDMQGNVLHELQGIGGVPFEWGTGVCWLPGNGILMAHGQALYATGAPFEQARLIREMPYEDWSLLAVDPGGGKIVVRIGNHLHMISGDGSSMQQITESNFTESAAAFSPDGKYLLIGTDHTRTGPFGSYFRLKIIPADGKTYVVDPLESNSPGVIPVIAAPRGELEAASGRIFWR